MREPQATMNHAVFGRKFTGAKKVFPRPFFDFTPGPGTRIKLRYPEFDDVYQCAKHHWECRLDLTCRKGHPLVETLDHHGPANLCFACNLRACGAGHYKCISGCSSFQVCSACMVKRPVVSQSSPSLTSPVALDLPDAPRHAVPLPELSQSSPSLTSPVTLDSPDAPRHAVPPPKRMKFRGSVAALMPPKRRTIIITHTHSSPKRRVIITYNSVSGNCYCYCYCSRARPTIGWHAD